MRSVKKRGAYPPVFKVLSDRELEITELMAKHMSNKRNRPESVFIRGNCEAVHQSDLFQITDSRDVRVKRKYLLEMMEGKANWKLILFLSEKTYSKGTTYFDRRKMV